MTETDLLLDNRAGLPEPLRILLREYPREAWEAHPQFTGLVQFWLERHMTFRKLMEMLRSDTEAMLDRNLDPQQYAARLLRFGGMLVSQLHGHHQIEDAHYFPALAELDARIAPGFDMLDRDHHALHDLIERFSVSANGVLRLVPEGDGVRDGTAAFGGELRHFERLLRRHLSDEEELIVPVILRHGGAGLA